MKFVLAIVLVSFVAFNALPSAFGEKKIRACYYTNWSQYRPGAGQYWPEFYEPGICSHIFFAFVGMGDDFKLQPLEKNDLDDLSGRPRPGLYSRINELKSKQADLVTSLAFGGFLFGQEKGELMRKMLGNKSSRQIFIADVIKVVRKHKFNGFDINWYPTAADKNNFVLLVKEMRDAFEKEKTISKLPRLLLTAAVPPVVKRIQDGYDGKALSSSLDFFNVMAFDYHGAWENQTGFNTPISDREGDGLSINATIRHLIDDQKIPAKQLLMGLAAYGRGWTISGTAVPNQIPSPAIGPSPPGPFTNASGHLAYYEICSMIEKDGFIVEWDEIAQAPFAYKKGVSDSVWISFDNVKSYNAELNYMIENELAGVFVWTLDQDDFGGQCKSSKEKYPLIKLVSHRLGKGVRELSFDTGM